MWRISLTVSVLLLCLLAVPLSYFNPRSGHTYNILIAIGLFLVYQNGLTFLRNAVEDGKIHFWLGLLPMHIIMFVIAVVLLRVRSMPSQPFWQAVAKSLTLKGGKMNLISRYIIRQMAVMAVYALLAFLALYSFFEIINEVG